MKVHTTALILISMLILAACGAPPATPSLPGEAGGGVAPVLTPEGVGPRAVSFVTEDGVALGGTLYGSGSTAVIFSHMFPTDQTSWTAVAQELAGRGYMALTYDFRGYGASEGEKNVSRIDRDLRAAVAFVREQGATDLVLVGASMGGTATAKVSAAENPVAVIIISAPVSFRGLTVSDDEVRAITAPKLFIGSEQDAATRDTLHMFDVAPEPKEKHVYPGSGHGTFIFDSQYGDDLMQRIVRFVETNVR